MRKIFSLLFAMLLTVGIVSADWKYNPFTGQFDYYEAGLPSGTSGDIVYYNGTSWVALNKGSNGEVLTLAAGLPSWGATGAGDMTKAVYDANDDSKIDISSNTNLAVDSNELTLTGDSIGLADHDTARTALGLAIGTDVQAYDADLTTYAGITPSANIQTFLSSADFAAMMANLSGTATAGFSLNSQGLTSVASIAGPAAALDINTNVIQDVNFWDTIASGNPKINIYGYITAGTARRYASLWVDDTADSFNIDLENNANLDYLLFNLQETNQKIRIAQNSDTLDIYLDGTDVHFDFSDTGSYIFDSASTAATSVVMYEAEASGSNYLTQTVAAMAANWTWTWPTADATNSNTPLVDSDGSGTGAFSGNVWLDDITGTTEVSVNDGSNDLDFRVEGNGEANLFRTDAGNDEIEIDGCVVSEYYDNGNAGANATIDWGRTNKQKITLDQNSTFAFTAPDTAGACSLTLIVIQDGTGNRTVTWPGTVDWGAGGEPTLSTGASKQDMIMFLWDGSEYKGGYLLGF